jgi:hypothetical protein
MDVDLQPTEVDIECLHIDMLPLADAIRRHIREWIVEYGKTLHQHAKTHIVDLKAQIEAMSKELFTNPETLEELKSVLQVNFHNASSTVQTVSYEGGRPRGKEDMD